MQYRTLGRTGLRVSEAAGLDVSGLDRAQQTVRVLGKGGKERIVPYGRRAATALEAYLAERAEMEHLLRQAIDTLPERERTVLHLYYYEELTLREIGEVLGVTESRVSQLHTKAILRLKARLAGSPAREPLER